MSLSSATPLPPNSVTLLSHLFARQPTTPNCHKCDKKCRETLPKGYSHPHTHTRTHAHTHTHPQVAVVVVMMAAAAAWTAPSHPS